ncbi:MAG: hypothetical protein L6R35_003389 [Caloplaca aegaea]|nr:MAG: hypothetical protein L6R35_003389 [Caloplaca aegaea]
MTHERETSMAPLSSLLGLPNELLREISSHLTRIEHKGLRRVCHRLKEILTPLIFTTAYIATRRQVFETFKALSNHPELAQHVVEIIYDASWFDEEIAEYHRQGIRVPKSDVIVTPESQERFVQAFDEQERITIHELAPVMQDSVKHFPGLRRLIWADLARSPGFRWDRIEDLGGIFRVGETQWAETKPNLTHQRFRKLLFSDLDYHANSTRMYHGLIVLLKALSQPDCKAQITDLRLGDSAYARTSGGVPDVVFKALSDSIYGPSSAFEHLRRLDITINQHEDASHHEQRFPRFPHLESLRLVAPMCSPPTEKYAPTLRESAIRLPRFCGAPHWPRLGALELKWVLFEAHYLLDLLRQHRDTLHYINLYEIYIRERSACGTVIRGLRSLYPDLVDEPYRYGQRSYEVLVLDFTLYDGRAALSNTSTPLGCGGPSDDYDEDDMSNYSADGHPESEERYSSEELDFSDGGDGFEFDTWQARIEPHCGLMAAI